MPSKNRKVRPAKSKKRPFLKNIKSIGLELEGGYCRSCIRPLVKGYRGALHFIESSDGTVEVNGSCKQCGNPLCEYGELKVWVPKTKIPILFRFLEGLFNSGMFKQNSTCGNHIHILLSKKEGWKPFASYEAWTEFVQSYRKLFKGHRKFIRRLSNSWCSSRCPFVPNGQQFTTLRELRDMLCYSNGGSMINFGSLSYHRTLEFRILPYFSDSKEALTSYSKMFDLIDYLAGKEQ